MSPEPTRFQWAVIRMRYFQQKEEEARLSVADHRDVLKQQYRENYQRTDRETFGALEETVTQLANSDTIGKTLIGDENYYRGLVVMYTQIALVERAVEEKDERERASQSVRHDDASCPQRVMA